MPFTFFFATQHRCKENGRISAKKLAGIEPGLVGLKTTALSIRPSLKCPVYKPKSYLENFLVEVLIASLESAEYFSEGERQVGPARAAAVAAEDVATSIGAAIQLHSLYSIAANR